MQDIISNDSFIDVELKDIIDLDFLQKFQDSFAESMNMASITVDLKGNQLTRPSCFTKFCMDMTRKTELGGMRCAECDRRGGEKASKTGKPVIYTCHAGLIDFAAPIMLKGKQMGSILGGQVLTDYADEKKLKKIAGEIGVDSKRYIEAVKKIRIVPRKNVEIAAEMLFIVANTLSRIGYQQYKLKNMSGIIKNNISQVSLTVEEMAASSIDITENQQNLNDEIEEVRTFSKEISEIVKLIKLISNKTKILGMNASIEAARAGDAGRGFDVVAKEIRKLSQQVMQTIEDIEKININIHKSIDKTVEMADNTLCITQQQSAAMEETNAALQEILALSEQLDEIANE